MGGVDGGWVGEGEGEEVMVGRGAKQGSLVKICMLIYMVFNNLFRLVGRILAIVPI